MAVYGCNRLRPIHSAVSAGAPHGAAELIKTPARPPPARAHHEQRGPGEETQELPTGSGPEGSDGNAG